MRGHGIMHSRSLQCGVIPAGLVLILLGALVTVRRRGAQVRRRRDRRRGVGISPMDREGQRRAAEWLATLPGGASWA
jgi:hypothetical protein